jgi:hypothetical protein
MPRSTTGRSVQTVLTARQGERFVQVERGRIGARQFVEVAAHQRQPE